MNKAELIDELADALDTSRSAAGEALEAVIDTIQRSLAMGEAVVITGFGKFESRVRNARIARNPQTGAAVKVKKTTVPAFKAGADLKKVVSGEKKLAKKTTKKATAKKAPAKKAPAKKAAVKKAPAKKAAVKKAPAKKAPAKKAPAKKAAAKKAPAKKTTRR